MDLKCDRIGKVALIVAMTDEEEEKIVKQLAKATDFNFKLAVTFVSGLTSEIKNTFLKSVIGCALQNEIIEKNDKRIHALVHAGIDALAGITHSAPIEGSLKLKIAIVADSDWIAVAIYGDSAFYPLTNHERACLGVMHL
ncbi:MAG TPA: HutP family protein [Spirochaetota bacterium]|nr:HutP family protein [Spirochaetota bacterium]HPJ34239.1 HutP family protein [Spirochaetota bacterium]